MSKSNEQAETNEEQYLNILNISDVQLVLLALKSSRSECLPVSQIYNYIEHFFRERALRPNWKNSIRHCLSTHILIFGSKDAVDKYGQKMIKSYYILPEYNQKLDVELERGKSLLMAIRTFRGSNSIDKIASYAKIDSAPYYLQTNQQNVKQKDAVFCSPKIANTRITKSKEDDALGSSTESTIRKAWNRDDTKQKGTGPIPASFQRPEMRQQPSTSSYSTFRFKPAGKAMAPIFSPKVTTQANNTPTRPSAHSMAIGNLLHTNVVLRATATLPREMRFVNKSSLLPNKNNNPTIGGAAIPNAQSLNEYNKDDRRRVIVKSMSGQQVNPVKTSLIYSPHVSSMNRISAQGLVANSSASSRPQLKLPVKEAKYHPYNSLQTPRPAHPPKKLSYTTDPKMRPNLNPIVAITPSRTSTVTEASSSATGKTPIPTLHPNPPIPHPFIVAHRPMDPLDGLSAARLPHSSSGSATNDADLKSTVPPLPIRDSTVVIPRRVVPLHTIPSSDMVSGSSANTAPSLPRYPSTPQIPHSTRLISPPMDTPSTSNAKPLGQSAVPSPPPSLLRQSDIQPTPLTGKHPENHEYSSTEKTPDDAHHEITGELPMKGRHSSLDTPAEKLSIDDLSSMEILEPRSKLTAGPTTSREIPPSTIITPKKDTEQADCATPKRADDDDQTSRLRISKIVWKPDPPSLKSSILPPPVSSVPSPPIVVSVASSPLTPNRSLIDLSKRSFTTPFKSLPVPIKKRDVQSIRLAAPVRLPVKHLSPKVRTVDAAMKNRSEVPSVHRSQVVRSLMEKSQKKEETTEVAADTPGVSRRRAEKDRVREIARQDTTNPIERVGHDVGDCVIFAGTARKRRIVFNCTSIEFDDCQGFDADNSPESFGRLDERTWMENSSGLLNRTGDDAPWKDSLVDFTMKRTEKEREHEKKELMGDEKTKREAKTARRKEIAQLKKEGKTVERRRVDAKKNKKAPFDTTIDRYIESRADSVKRRKREDYKLLMKKTKNYLKRNLPFYLHRSINGILKENNNKRDNQRIIFTRVNPNSNLPIVVSGGVNRSIFLHDYATGEIVGPHRPHATYATDAAWSHCGRQFIACGTDRLVTIVDPDALPTVQTRLYSEFTPVGARFTEDRNLAFVAMETGQLDLFDLREDKGQIVRRITGIPDISCIDANPLDWSTLAIGCKNGLVTEFNFYEDHRKSNSESYFQYFIPPLQEPIFNNLRFDEYEEYCDLTEVKSIRYCASMHSDCADDLVVTKANRNEQRGDSAYKFSPGTNNPVVAYTPPEGFNISCATLAFNHNAAHKVKYNSCENYVVAGTEEGIVLAFDAKSGNMIKGGTAMVDDPSLFGNQAMKYLKKDLDLARILAYVPIKKYFPHERAGFDPDLATRLTAIDAVPDPYTGAFVVGGWGVNPTLNVYRFHNDSAIEHLLHL